jgi:hypothetical protein
VFTDWTSQKLLAVRRFDIVGMNEIDRLSTRLSVSIFDDNKSGIDYYEVVGSFEETAEKIEACE